MEDSPKLVSQKRGGSFEFLWEHKLTAREAHILGMVSASIFVFVVKILSVLLVLIIVPQRAMNTRSALMATISFYLLNSDVSNLSHFFLPSVYETVSFPTTFLQTPSTVDICLKQKSSQIPGIALLLVSVRCFIALP